MRLVASIAILAASVAACTLKGDDPVAYTPDPLGTGSRIAEIQNPASPGYAPNTTVSVSSTVVTWVDTFDETQDGKSVGNVFVQDLNSQAPYSGMTVYEASYIPSSLHLLPGDVLDFVGPYQEETGVGSATFPTGQTLPQFSKPVGTFDYNYTPPGPTTIQLSDIDQSNYLKGRQWEGMLVTVNDVTLGPGVDDSDRVTYIMSTGDATADTNAAEIDNELYDLRATDFATGTHFSSVTGIVTWFYSYHIAPRSAADLQK